MYIVHNHFKDHKYIKTVPKFLFNKIIRKKIYKRLLSKNLDVEVKKLNKSERIEAIQNKLLEEINEVIAAKNKAELIEEIADVIEVLHCFCTENAISFTDIEAQRSKKAQIDGNLDPKQLIYSVNMPNDHNDPYVQYYIKYLGSQPERYKKLCDS